MAESFAELDRLIAAAFEADPLKPGMWRLGDRLGKYVEDWWDVADRAAAKFGGPAPADEAMRFARAKAMVAK